MLGADAIGVCCGNEKRQLHAAFEARWSARVSWEGEYGSPIPAVFGENVVGAPLFGGVLRRVIARLLEPAGVAKLVQNSADDEADDDISFLAHFYLLGYVRLGRGWMLVCRR